MVSASAATETEEEQGSNEASSKWRLQNQALPLTLEWGFCEGSTRGRWPLGPHPC